MQYRQGTAIYTKWALEGQGDILLLQHNQLQLTGFWSIKAGISEIMLITNSKSVELDVYYYYLLSKSLILIHFSQIYILVDNDKAASHSLKFTNN